MHKAILGGSLLALAGLMSGPALAAQEMTVQGGAPVPYLGFLPVYVAEHAGFFKEEGLDVQMNYASNAGMAAQLVAAGNGDLAVNTFEPTAQGVEKGMKTKIFLQTNESMLYYVGIPQDSGIKEISDLKGKKIGVSNLGSSALPIIKSMLDESGVPHSSSTFLPVGVGGQAMAALNTGKVDALALWDGIYFGLERGGAKLNYLYHPTLHKFGNFGYMTSDQALKNKNDELCAFGRAVGKANYFLHENPRAVVPMYWESNPSARGNGDEDAFNKTLDEITKMVATYGSGDTFGAIDKQGFTAYLSMLKEQGYISKPLSVEDVATDALTACANEFDKDAVREQARAWKN